MNTRLEGARVTLRPLEPSDLDRIVAYRNHPDVARFQGWDSYDPAAATLLISEMAASVPGTAGRWHQWGIEERAGGALAGDFGLRTFDDGVTGEIGFTLAPDAQGRGLATEAAALVLDLAFGALAFHRVIACTDPLNARAAALLKRLGFRQEGRAIEATRVGERWVDDDLWAMLAREWRAR